MDIRCERCATEYELDETKIPDAGVTIKCATCQNVFKVMKPVAAPAAAEPPPVRIRLYRSGNTQDLNCPDEPTLRVWISENRVLRTDAITFDGAAWVPLADVPELADAFPKAPEPKPPPPPAPKPAMPPAPASSPAPTRAEKTPQLHAGATPSAGASDATIVDLPRFQMPPLVIPQPPPPEPKPAPPPAKDPSSDSIASLGKLNRSVEGAPPSFPSLALPSDPSIVPAAKAPPPAPKPVPPPPAPPPPPPRAAAKPPPPPPPSRPPPAAKPVDQQLTQPPKTKASPKPMPPLVEKHERRPGEGTDFEIAQFKKQGGPVRLIAGIIVGVVLIGGGVAGFMYWRNTHIPDDARVPYEAGRTLYFTGVRASYAEAATDFQKAIEASPAPYADAQGALSEVQMAWAEGLINEAEPARNDANEKKKALDKAPTDAALRAAYNAAAKIAGPLQDEAAKHLQAGIDAAKAALAINDACLPARRASLDYQRLQNDSENGQKEEKILITDMKAADPETKAHVAAFDALNASQIKVAEQSLTDVTKAKPEFVRAWIWLAQIHKKEGNTAQAQTDLKTLLKAVPANEEAANALKLLQAPPPPPPGAVVASATGAAAGQPEAAPAGPEVDKLVDKLLKEGDKSFEHKKYAKALEDYEKAVTAKPSSVDANFSRGLALSTLKRFDAAVDAFQKTLSLSPKHGDAMIALAEAYKSKGQKHDAAKYYQQYVDTFPKGENAAAAAANLKALR